VRVDAVNSDVRSSRRFRLDDSIGQHPDGLFVPDQTTSREDSFIEDY
jgi:hypothetical protein